jgi:cytochrome d ubiquinol oxidase subunit II
MTGVFDFVPIWTLILGIAVFFYVLLDGFDLGVGILFGLAPDTASRNIIMNSIAPIWDGNETWLVLGGLGLLAAFPLAFAVIKVERWDSTGLHVFQLLHASNDLSRAQVVFPDN